MNEGYAKLFQDSMKEYHKLLFEEHPYEFKQALEWNAKHHRYFFHRSSFSFILYGITHDDVFEWEKRIKDNLFETYKEKSGEYASFEDFIKQTNLVEVPFLMQRIIDTHKKLESENEQLGTA